MIELKSDVERELAAQAAGRVMDVTAYAASLLEQAAMPASRSGASKPSPNS